MDSDAAPEPGSESVARTGATDRNLPERGWPRLNALLGRGIARRCPECGGNGIFRNWLTIRDNCPHCRYQFEREHGYFLGSYVINLVFAEFLTVAVMVYLLVATDLNWVAIEAIIIPMAIGLPLLFFPYSRTLWMALDLYFQPENQL